MGEVFNCEILRNGKEKLVWKAEYIHVLSSRDFRVSFGSCKSGLVLVGGNETREVVDLFISKQRWERESLVMERYPLASD